MRRRAHRPVLLALAVPALLALPVASKPSAEPRPVRPVVRELAVTGLANAAARNAAGRVSALTRAVTAVRFEAIGVTWETLRPAPELDVEVRVRQGGKWTDWHDLDADSEDAPDDGSADMAAGVRDGTSLYYSGPADGYQARVTLLSGTAPRDVRVALIDPGGSAADQTLGQSPVVGGSVAHAAQSRPPMITRAQWGADESLRRGSPSYSPTLLMGFVHHTDTSNSYSMAQAPAMVRSVYAFHVKSRGWSDIGYNFLIDKYGRVFEGRYGGVDKPVIGAHTGGFNSRTFGASLLGNYTSVSPARNQLIALQKLFAWKFGLHYVNPRGTTILTSAGSSKYSSGTKARFNNIAGHRDAGLTACPGTQTYRQLAGIRTWTKNYMGAALYTPSVSNETPLYKTDTFVTVKAGVAGSQSWRVTITDATTGAFARRVSGTASTAFSWSWNLRATSGRLVPPAAYQILVESWNSAGAARSWSTTVLLRSPLPDGLAVTQPDGTPALLEDGRLLPVSPALARALRGDVVVPAFAAQVTGLGGVAATLADGALVRSPSGTAFAIVNGERRGVPGSVLSALRMPPSPVVPDAVLNLLRRGANLTATDRHPDGELVSDGSTTWRVESGVRRPFTSDSARAAWAKGRVTAPAVDGDLALPVGAPLGPPDGTVLRTESGNAGVVSDGLFRPFADLATGRFLGYPVDTAPMATSSDLAALGTGAVVTTAAHPSGTLLKSGTAYWSIAGGTKVPVDPALVALDHRTPVSPLSGELDALGVALAAAPNGLAGRASDGSAYVVDNGRLVRLSAADERRLGYDNAPLPAMERAEFGVFTSGAALAAPDRHTDGSLVTDGLATWLLVDGVRRPLATTLVATYAGRPALPATTADLALAEGAPAPPATGSWVEVEDGSRWLVVHGVRRAVSPAVAYRLGLDVTPVVTVAADELGVSTTAGPAVP